MIKKDNCQILGFIPRDFKRRIKKIVAQSQWSESRLVKEGLLRIVPEVERELSLNHEQPRRKNTAA